MKLNSIMLVVVMVCMVPYMAGTSLADAISYSEPVQSAFVTISREAEDFSSKSGPIGTIIDGLAFNNNALQTSAPPYRGWAKYVIDVPQAGVYVMWGRVKGQLNGWANSFFVAMDNGRSVPACAG